MKQATKQDGPKQRESLSEQLKQLQPKTPESPTWGTCPKHPPSQSEIDLSLRELIAQVLQYLEYVEGAIKSPSLADNTVLLAKGDQIRGMIDGIYKVHRLDRFVVPYE